MSIDWTALEACLAGVPVGVDVGCSAIALGGGRGSHNRWSRNGNRQYPSASTAKIPIMVQVYRMLDARELALDDPFVLENAHKANGSGVLRHMDVGLKLSIRDLLYLMISISDNTATNALIDIAGMADINATMQRLGMHDSILGRPMVGRLAIAGEQENLATPDDYTRILAAICRHEAASAWACDAMLETLQLQQNPRRIGRHAAGVDGIEWGSKTGTNNGVVNDVGFVRGARGTALLAVFCRGVNEEVSGEAIVSSIARATMQGLGLLPG